MNKTNVLAVFLLPAYQKLLKVDHYEKTK